MIEISFSRISRNWGGKLRSASNFQQSVVNFPMGSSNLRHRWTDGRAFEAVYDGRRLPATVSDEQREYTGPRAGSLSAQQPPLPEQSTLIRRLTGR